jgi:ABC-type sugar transport system permease subunit
LARTRHHFLVHQMSQLSPGPGWWLASDGQWYPPQTAPPPSSVPPTPPLGLPPLSAPAFASGGSFQPGLAATPPYSGVAQGGSPYLSAPGPFATPRTSPMAIWALVLVILLGAIGALVGIPLAFVARSKIRQSGGALRGSGLALAALIIGFVWVALLAIAIAIPTFLGVTHSGPAVQNLNFSVQSQIIGTGTNDFDVAGVGSVSCQRPESWTTGSTFTCMVFGSAGQVIGRYYGTVQPNAPGGIYQWTGRYLPSP